MALPAAVHIASRLARGSRAAVAVYPTARMYAGVFFSSAAALAGRGSRQNIYNILWAVVFGFATLNILSLAARRMEPTRRGMSFGEMLAVCTVVVSVILLGWELLSQLHLFPLKVHH